MYLRELNCETVEEWNAFVTRNGYLMTNAVANVPVPEAPFVVVYLKTPTSITDVTFINSKFFDGLKAKDAPKEQSCKIIDDILAPPRVIQEGM